MSTLTPEQTTFLLAPIHPSRIGKDGKGFSHLEAWDVRRTLIRVFGFGGYSTDIQDMTLIREIEHPSQQPGGKSRWSVIYRATVLLTVRTADGTELGHWHGTAMGDAANQPSLADAHDLAMKTADSQAFKRAAVNLGDQFGLSLYNDGSTDPVVNRSLAHPQPEAGPDTAQLTQLATGTVQAAMETTDPETVRGLYRKAQETGLLQQPAATPFGEMELGRFLVARGEQLAASSVNTLTGVAA